jgi:hypothetical protein
LPQLHHIDQVMQAMMRRGLMTAPRLDFKGWQVGPMMTAGRPGRAMRRRDLWIIALTLWVVLGITLSIAIRSTFAKRWAPVPLGSKGDLAIVR